MEYLRAFILWTGLAITSFSACLLLPAMVQAYGGDSGSDGLGGDYATSGPSIPYAPGIEGMPVIDPRYDSFSGSPDRNNKETPARQDWKQKALVTLSKYLKNKAQDYIDKKLGFPPILPPPLQAIKEAYDGITSGVEITKDVLDTLETARKQLRDPYTKAAGGTLGSNLSGIGPDGTPSGSPGYTNPNSPGFENVGGGGPQKLHDSNFLM
ncbi:MAG: hypothetical protein H0S80_13395 [Desulfovibrionaceae bacterium]|nr:hypothetical protein [Desulfovibrionaceae bacterium]